MIELDLTIRRPEFSVRVAFTSTEPVTAIFGPSGAGKSTLLHAVAGLVRPESGRIAIGGQVLFDHAAGIDLPPHRRRIGVVFQHGALFPHYSVEGNLRYGEHRVPVSERRFAFTQVVELLHLAPLLRRPPSSLSGGERQRVALGRALLSSPRLLCCDEPLSSLDHRLKHEILPFFKGIRDTLGIPMLYVTHDLAEMLHLTDRLVVLERGLMSGWGTFTDLINDPAVRPLLCDDELLARLRSPAPGNGPADHAPGARSVDASS